METTQKQIEDFVTGCQAIVDENMKDYMPHQKKTLEVAKGGRRYKKIVVKYETMGVDGEYQKASYSVHCFVDTTNGDVLKAAGWKKPAKHARGNLNDDTKGLGCMTAYGAKYLR